MMSKVEKSISTSLQSPNFEHCQSPLQGLIIISTPIVYTALSISCAMALSIMSRRVLAKQVEALPAVSRLAYSTTGMVESKASGEEASKV